MFTAPYSFSQEIKIDSGFERGSIGSLKQVSADTFSGQTMHWIKRDKNGNQCYWFYFMITNVKDRTLTFELKNMAGIYRGHDSENFAEYVQPVVSYDNENWERITDVEYDNVNKIYTFTAHFSENRAWIAYAHPYTVSQYNEFIESISDNQYVKTEIIGSSVEGRALRMLTITNPGAGDTEKKVVLMTALQHSGEDCAGYFMEGLIRELLSDKPEIEAIRDKFIFKLVPVMNPDGLFHGTSRYNWAMEDLNSSWGVDGAPAENEENVPEVIAVKHWTKDWLTQGNGIDIFFDVHSNSQFNRQNALHHADNNLGRFHTLMNTRLPSVNVPRGFGGSAANFYYAFYNVPAGTIELTGSFLKDYPGEYLEIEDYLGYGSGLVYSLEEYSRK